MKTTLDIADSILERARGVTAKEGVTLRSLVEQGLVRVLDEREHPAKHVVRPVTFRGKGLSPEFRGASWTAIRDAAYAGRGS